MSLGEDKLACREWKKQFILMNGRDPLKTDFYSDPIIADSFERILSKIIEMKTQDRKKTRRQRKLEALKNKISNTAWRPRKIRQRKNTPIPKGFSSPLKLRGLTKTTRRVHTSSRRSRLSSPFGRKSSRIIVNTGSGFSCNRINMFRTTPRLLQR